jgi:hypothetical protein
LFHIACPHHCIARLGERRLGVVGRDPEHDLVAALLGTRSGCGNF